LGGGTLKREREREEKKTYQLKCDFSAAQSIEENDPSQKN